MKMLQSRLSLTWQSQSHLNDVYWQLKILCPYPEIEYDKLEGCVVNIQTVISLENATAHSGIFAVLVLASTYYAFPEEQLKQECIPVGCVPPAC